MLFYSTAADLFINTFVWPASLCKIDDVALKMNSLETPALQAKKK